MNLRNAFKETCCDIEAGNATIIKSPPGFGKTDLMSKVASWYVGQHPNERIGYSCFFMATQTPIGFTGLPWKGERVWKDAAGTEHRYTITDPAIPQWYMATDLRTGDVLPANMFDKVLLVIEEWGQGSPETKRAGAEVLRAGGTPPFYLPPGSPRIALSNVDARDGVTKEFDFIIGRRREITVEGDVDVWVEDFADRPYKWQGKEWSVMPVTKAWAKANPQIVFEPKPEKQGPWCNPRTLTMLDRYVQVAAAHNGGKIPVNQPSFTEALAGYVGMAAGVSYGGHLQFHLDLPPYEDVIKDPAGCAVPQKADLQMLMAYELAGRCKPEHLAEVIQYMTKKGANGLRGMPQDMAIAFITSLLRRDWKAIINEPAMKAWVAKNAQLTSIIAAMAN